MKSARPRVRIVDAKGREWDVYEFSIRPGKPTYFDVGSGSGQYRGFVPVDGGARRRRLMWAGEEKISPRPEWLLEQLQLSKLDSRDDAVDCARRGATPERRDPSPTVSDAQT